MNPRIINHGSLFLGKESTICTSVVIQWFSAISFLSIISLKIDISMRSLLFKIWVEECTESLTQELSVLQKILMLSLLSFNCSISYKNFL